MLKQTALLVETTDFAQFKGKPRAALARLTVCQRGLAGLVIGSAVVKSGSPISGWITTGGLQLIGTRQ